MEKEFAVEDIGRRDDGREGDKRAESGVQRIQGLDVSLN